MDIIRLEAVDDVWGKINFDTNPLASFFFADHIGCAAPAKRVQHQVSRKGGHLNDTAQQFGRESVCSAIL